MNKPATVQVPMAVVVVAVPTPTPTLTPTPAPAPRGPDTDPQTQHRHPGDGAHAATYRADTDADTDGCSGATSTLTPPHRRRATAAVCLLPAWLHRPLPVFGVGERVVTRDERTAPVASAAVRSRSARLRRASRQSVAEPFGPPVTAGTDISLSGVGLDGVGDWRGRSRARHRSVEPPAPPDHRPGGRSGGLRLLIVRRRIGDFSLGPPRGPRPQR